VGDAKYMRVDGRSPLSGAQEEELRARLARRVFTHGFEWVGAALATIDDLRAKLATAEARAERLEAFVAVVRPYIPTEPINAVGLQEMKDALAALDAPGGRAEEPKPKRAKCPTCRCIIVVGSKCRCCAEPPLDPDEEPFV
jgi:hypothetical protein